MRCFKAIVEYKERREGSKDEHNIPAKQAEDEEDARLQEEDGYGRRKKRDIEKAGQGQEEADALSVSMVRDVGRAGRITRSSEYRSMYEGGTKLAGKYYVMFFRRHAGGSGRAGITVSGKVGGAVVRNRAKRRTREALRKVLATRRLEADIVLVALKRITDAPFDGLVKDIEGLLSRIKY